MEEKFTIYFKDDETPEDNPIKENLSQKVKFSNKFLHGA